MATQSTRLWDKGETFNEEIRAFTVGNDPIIDLNLVRWDCIGSAAHAKMLTSKNILNTEEYNALIKSLGNAYKKSLEGTYVIPPHLEDVHTSLEVFLTEECGEAGKRIHTARSRNDQIIITMRLYLRQSILEQAKHLLSIAAAALKQAQPHIRVQMPGYTHFQQAMPASVGMWYASIAEATLSLAREAVSLFHIANENPLGAASGFYTPIEIDRQLTTELMKFERTQRNPIEIQNSRGRHEIRLCRLHSDILAMIEKYSSDIIQYTMTETSFFTIPVEFTTGSSIMPQKRNPDVLELLRGQASKVRACQFELESIAAKLPSHYHRDFQLTKDPLFRSTDTTATAISIFAKVLEGLKYNEEVLEKTKTPELYATYYAFRLVKEGIPFREAYKKTADDLAAGLINCEDLSKDFEPIAKVLENEVLEANKELELISDKITSLIKDLATLPDELLGL